MRKLKKTLGSILSKAWILIFVLVMVVLGIRLWSISQYTPTLEEVLAREELRNSQDFPIFVASLLALSLATISVAKGYEIFKRSRSIASTILPETPVSSDSDDDRMIEGLRQNVSELKKVKEWLQQENIRLKECVGSLTLKLEKLVHTENMLKKSNISLSKECERLKSENEILTLEINSLKIKPKRAAKKKAKTRMKNKRSKSKK